MSVLDRVRQHQKATEQDPDSPSTSLVLADPPAIARARKLIHWALGEAKKGRSIPFFLEAIVDEALSELSEVDPDNFMAYIEAVGGVLHWVATGDESDIPGFLAGKEIPGEVLDKKELLA